MSNISEVEQKLLEGIACPYSGDYHLADRLMWICVAVEKDGPRIIGSYTDFAVLSSPKGAQRRMSSMIWRNYIEGGCDGKLKDRAFLKENK